MRVINSGWRLARELREELRVLWLCNAELNCPFESLFQPVTEFKITGIHSVADPRKLFYQKTARNYLTNEDIVAHRSPVGLDPEYAASLQGNSYIFTWEWFYPAEDYHLFRPTEALQARIDEMSARFGSSCVGVHIRRTDNQPAIGKSSTDAFLLSMRRELEYDPDTTFYLATDDLAEEAVLRDAFPGRILSNEKRCLRRDSAEGMYDALLDLYCLANTRKIIGSYFSSFTDIAADMHHIPKVIAGADD
ncbi:MAG: hypothetical protein LUC60_09190 [Lachnospiraceae bacterium]|nr:hypothetical protein [Lachnospiraceae bacterium]